MKRLVNLRIEHVAGVDRPANKRRFLIVKSEKPAFVEKQIYISHSKSVFIREEDGKFCLYNDMGDQLGEYDTTEEAEAAAMVEVHKHKSQEQKGVPMLTKEQIAKIGDKDIQEAAIKQQEEMLELEKKNKDLDAELAKAKAQPPAKDDDDDEKIWKGVPPAIRNRYDALMKEKEKTEKNAKDEKDLRETQHWTQKSSDFKYLQIVPQHFGKVMKVIAEHCSTEADEIMRILGVADGLIAKGAIFQEFGKTVNNSTVNDATNIVARVEALAADYQQLDPKLKKDDAIAKVFENHGDWYGPYTREVQVKV